MQKYFFAAMLVLSAFVSPVFAQSTITIDSSPAEIRSAQDGIKTGLEKKQGKYKDYNEDDRKAILNQQKAIYAILEGKAAISELDEEEKVNLVNALESVNAMLAKADDDRMICERVKVVGSNMPQSKCMSVGQRRQMREAAQRDGIRTTN